MKGAQFVFPCFGTPCGARYPILNPTDIVCGYPISRERKKRDWMFLIF